MKWLRLILALGALSVLPASPASAAGESVAVCQGAWNVSFASGLGTTAKRVAFTTHGESGSFNCVGVVRGNPVTGSGTFGQEGFVEGTVLMGAGTSTISLTIPTSAGPQKLSFQDTFTYFPGIGFKQGGPLVGPLTWVFRPTAGNGVTEPVTEIGVVGEAVIRT